jgi:hypothetical protein
MDLGKKIAVLFLLLTIGISVKTIIDREANVDIPEIAGQSSSWLYRKGIYIKNSEFKTLFEQEIELEIDTKGLISKGKLQENCNDIRFLDEDNETPLQFSFRDIDSTNYGCNTIKTKIIINLPSLSKDGKTIYLLYGNSIAPSL